MSLDFTDLEVCRSDLHNNRLQGIPPSMPAVPHYPVVGHIAVGTRVVLPIQVRRVTSSGKNTHQQFGS